MDEQNNKTKTFQPVSTKVSFPKLEEEILTYWKDNKIFEKSIENRKDAEQWTFLDGPPFVTGMPHYGSLLSSLTKDVFGRYYTMKGFRVPRVWGWDGHGLPIENKVEGKLDIKSKKEIEQVVGVKKFIEECKKYVEEISGEWEWYVDHIGRWVDFKNAYKTWNTDYMESVMWVFKQMYERGYIYKGLRVTLYCPHCSTPISNFEVAMDADNYKEVPDFGTTYKYPLVGEDKTFILAWSTTPWNKIVTPALAVNPELEYIKVKQNGEYYILAKDTIKNVIDRHSGEDPAAAGDDSRILTTGKPRFNRGKQVDSGQSQNGDKMPKQVRNDSTDYEIIEEFMGSELIGKEFVPHYDYYKDRIEEGQKAFIVIGGDFVTADEGTGVVTIAAYGEEDLIAMKKDNIHVEMHVDEEGHIKDDVPLFGGMYYLKANKVVNEDLEKRNLIYRDEQFQHNVPLCWRCHTRLYYAPITAWYVNVQDLKGLMIRTNENINWFPKHFKYGRFLKSLENAPDWNISRNRYWGSPVPVWECVCGDRFVPGSIKELEEASGQKITDLHKPEIDEVKVICKSCGKKVNRVPEVLDSWIEAGSASFAERHYPFDSSQKLEDFFPPDYIAEYTGQIRAWFYVLHVIGAALYQSQAFKNVSVTGVILGSDGRKMSKNLKNYPDPKEMLEKYGGDALRLYLMGSPVMNGEDVLISEDQYKLQVRGMMLILWNVYNFFLTYAEVDGWNAACYSGDRLAGTDSRIPSTSSEQIDSGQARMTSKNVLDKWILSLLNQLIVDATESLDNFDTVTAISKLQKFVTEFSTWYLRRSRDRVGPTAENQEDKQAFYETTYEVLTNLCQLLAPITPFFSESIYRNLTGDESVHLSDWPNYESGIINQELEEEMQEAREIVELGHALRKQEGIRLRQPLREARIKNHESGMSEEIENVVKEELNVKSLKFETGEGQLAVSFDVYITEDLKEEGEARDLVRKIQEERKKLGTTMDEKVNVTLEGWPISQEGYIKKHALISILQKGLALQVEKA